MLRRCLQALKPVIGRDDVELIWVDNGSTDDAASFVSANYPEAKHKLLSENRGVAYARNRGVEMAAGQFILFLDDDTEASAEAIDFMLSYMQAHPQTGIAGCALRDSEGRLQDSFKAYPGLWCKVRNVVSSKLGIRRKELQLPANVVFPTYIIGACQLIRRQVFDKVGLLDEAIFYGPEDADLCIRARKAGYSTAYLPQVSILHHWRRITSRSLTSQASRRHISALLHFWHKHRRL